MPQIYDQHRAAFASVEAYVILKEGERVATVAFKFPKDGAGRLYAYVHWIGLEMVRGFATGGGYDKRTAACASAVKGIKATGEYVIDYTPELRSTFTEALAADRGHTWESALRNAGFTVLQAV